MGVEVELTPGGEKHILPGEEAEPPVMEIGVGEHKEAFLAALGQVHALGAARNANGRLGRLDVGVDDGGVEVATAPGYGPRSAGVAVELEEVIAGGLASEDAQPFDALDEAEGGLVRENAYAQKPSPGLGEDKAKTITVMAALRSIMRVMSMYQRSPTPKLPGMA